MARGPLGTASRAVPGSTFGLVIALGLGADWVVLPDIVGRDLDAAEAALRIDMAAQ